MPSSEPAIGRSPVSGDRWAAPMKVPTVCLCWRGRREAFRFGQAPSTIVRCCEGITLAKRNPKKKLRMPLTPIKTVADPREAFCRPFAKRSPDHAMRSLHCCGTSSEPQTAGFRLTIMGVFGSSSDRKVLFMRRGHSVNRTALPELIQSINCSRGHGSILGNSIRNPVVENGTRLATNVSA